MELSRLRARTDLRSFLISVRSFIMAEASVIASCVAFDDFLYLAVARSHHCPHCS